jgi:tRNA threonylcarbamoyl adenosine modification protein YjeE
MDGVAQSLFLADDAATAAFGARLAAILTPGDIVLLDGDLGAGKTAMARAIIRSLCRDPDLDVPSPSFALVQPYEYDGQAILHADLYRLAGESEIEELGLFDDPEAIVLIEWPERAPRLAGLASIVLQLAVPAGGAGRNLAMTMRDGRTV